MMTDAELDGLCVGLRDLAPLIDDITGPSSVLEIAAAKAIREAADAISDLRAERDALRKDAERLDWLGKDRPIDCELPTLRTAIDAAMQQIPEDV